MLEKFKNSISKLLREEIMTLQGYLARNVDCMSEKLTFLNSKSQM